MGAFLDDRDWSRKPHRNVPLIHLLAFLPLAAAAFAIPQFLPQIGRLRKTGDVTGISWAWAALTSVDNGAWLIYFALAHLWTALVPSISATVLAAVLVAMLRRRVEVRPRSAVVVSGWAALLVAALALYGRGGLGAVLTGAFMFQVTPSIWTAYRTQRPTGISRGTWMLIFGELSCWMSFGFYESDPRLIVLGCTGVTATILMLGRIAATRHGPWIRHSDRPTMEHPLQGSPAPWRTCDLEPTRTKLHRA
jgi:hypothetical protein